MSFTEQDPILRQTESQESNKEEKPPLTPRQIQILELAAEERSNAEIGEELNISRDTVKAHFSNRKRYGGTHKEGIFARLNASSRREAVVRAISLGVLNPEELVQEEELKKVKLLTNRELEILGYLANPTLPSLKTTDRQIADRLGISPGTIQTHINSILGKLEIKGRSYIGSTRAAVIFLAYKQRQKPTSPSHERLRPSTSSG